MNLRWNGTFRRFEAEFSSDFQGDLAAVKAAGFKTDGAPTWTWYTFKAGSLTKLRSPEVRPPSGLTISPEAREQYTSLSAMEEKNAEIKAQLAEQNKALKKKIKIDKQEACSVATSVSYYDVENECWVDPPLKPPVGPPFVQPRPEGNPNEDAPKCCICGTPVYFYEKLNPPTCLWCEKTVLDVESI